MRPLPLLALLAAPALAQTPPPVAAVPSLQNLVQNSPFGTATPAGQAAAAAGPLEFRGTFVDRGERFFSILDTGSRRAEWVGLKESGHAYTVKSFDPDSETVTLDYQGRSLSLKLRTARVTAMAVPPPQLAATPQPNVVIAPGTAVGPGVNPGPNTTEAQRLAQVAEEIRRRRALRQQAQGQQTTPPPAPPPNQPPR